ncbi:tRNA pseudouridine(55) synthase TruB [Candidatus Dependentiae bacterium]|nr:tRNA pseudouridine(55) synthase TruB [Candidatus Dependentiae bacterium]
MNGFLFIHKPVGITSFDCIRRLKKLLPRKTKIGHAGTLDPFAEGLMIIGIGKGTKQLNDLLGSNKSYRAVAKIGERTDTLDHTGTIMESFENPTPFDFYSAALNLMPSYEQTPPIFSSVKINGERLYKLARKASEPTSEDPALFALAENRKKTCTIYSLKVTHSSWPFITFETTTSKGTYIRSLANDIAKTQNSCATLYELTRTQIGKIPLSEAISLDKITDSAILDAQLLKNTLFFNTLTFPEKTI